jgi:hypothetical protein
LLAARGSSHSTRCEIGHLVAEKILWPVLDFAKGIEGRKGGSADVALARRDLVPLSL